MKLIFHTINDGVLEFESSETSVLIGRGSACDVMLKVEGISREHCKIEIDSDDNFLITDLGSTNGVLIDNKRIPPNKPTPYSSFLSLTIGPIPQVTLEMTEPSQAASSKQEAQAPMMKLEIDESSIRKNKIKKKAPAISKKKPAKTNFLPVIIGVILVVALTAMFFMGL
jgi:hypothetical protein